MRSEPLQRTPLRDGTNLTIEYLEKQSSGSRFKQLKAAELIGNIRKAGSNSQALYIQLSGMTDKLVSARYARFINKRFSELGAERFEEILEESRDLGAGWELEEPKDKLTNARKKSSVSVGEPGECFNVSKGLTEISEAPNTMNQS